MFQISKRQQLIKLFLSVFMLTLLASCGTGGLDDTYVACNDAAKQSMYTKFIFKGGKVKVVMGAMGIEMPGGYEYGFSREGDKVKIEMAVGGISIGGIDLHYDEKTDEIRLLFGGEVGNVLNEYAPVWAKEGTCDPNKKEDKKVIIPVNNDEKPKDKKENQLSDNNDNELLGAHFLSLCASKAYLDNPSIGGWNVSHKPLYEKVNLYCVVFENEENVVFAFRGTPLPSFNSIKNSCNSIKDWKQTLSYYIGDNEDAKHAQFEKLKEFVKNYMVGYVNENKKNIYITGHSLGGWLALMSYLELSSNSEYTAYSNQISAKIKRVVTFNSIGVSNSDTKLLNQYHIKNPDKILNYYACCDIARWASYDLGFSYPGGNFELILKNKEHKSGGHATPFSLNVVVDDIVQQYSRDNKNLSDKDLLDIKYRYGIATGILERNLLL